jgi:4-diphosphocytidyl-2-C-methyl-D-erythritol kinase
MTSAQMQLLVRRLGADCPVFIDNVPVFAEGIGDVFHELSAEMVQKTYCMLPPVGAMLPPTQTLTMLRNLVGYWLVLVKPDEFISTAEAYKNVHPRSSEYHLPDIFMRSVRQWKGRMVNDFEESVFPMHPVVEGIRDQMYMLGAHYSAMSGSGSTVFGLFPNKPILGNVFADHFLWQVEL